LPEHDSDVGGMIKGGVEVGVVADRSREFHFDGRLIDEGRGHQTLVGLQASIGAGQESSDGGASFAPVQVAQGHEVIQSATLEDRLETTTTK